MNKLYQLFKQYKYKLTIIYLFMLLTELSILSQPFLLGKSIDGLINNSYFWLMLFSTSYLVSTFFNYKRMVYDTKVYTQIYNSIVLKFLKRTDVDISAKVARTDMADHVVGVLAGYVHYYIATIVTVIGSIGFIYLENYRVGIAVSIAFICIVAAVSLFYKKIRQSIKVNHNHLEGKLKHLQAGYADSTSFFHRKRKLDIYESTLQGKNWLFIGLIKNTFLVIAILLLVNTSESLTIGGVITTYSYIHEFLISLMSIPVGIEMYSRLSDILKRL
jgi:hypothetical protein